MEIHPTNKSIFCVLAACALILGVWLQMPPPGLAGLALLTAGLAANLWDSRSSFLRKTDAGFKLAWAGTLLALPTLLLMTWAWDTRLGALAWLVAVALYLPARNTTAYRWQVLAMTWALSGGAIWLTACHWQNLRGWFHLGLLAVFCLLILCRRWFTRRTVSIQGVNTLLLLLVVLPLADLWARRLSGEASNPVHKYYLYKNGGSHPHAFGRWKQSFNEQYDRMAREIIRSKNRGPMSSRLRPDTHATFFVNRVDINNLGFRGRDISEKTNAYRIIALGESTTFGLGLTPQDRIWPALLEQMIRDRLKPVRLVEVINAGIPGYDLKLNMSRMTAEILPLKPDLLISYHGINGFYSISEALPRTYSRDPPVFRQRPIQLLAEAEFGLNVSLFNQRYGADPAGRPPIMSNPMDTEYAGVYRELINLARTNGMHLALATHSMAVNARSDPKVIEFYRKSFPVVAWQIKGNEAHNEIIRRLTADNPELYLVDTRPRLDGANDKFIDLVHFAPEGDAQMAETFFAALKPMLEKELGR